MLGIWGRFTFKMSCSKYWQSAKTHRLRVTMTRPDRKRTKSIAHSFQTCSNHIQQGEHTHSTQTVCTTERLQVSCCVIHLQGGSSPKESVFHFSGNDSLVSADASRGSSPAVTEDMVVTPQAVPESSGSLLASQDGKSFVAATCASSCVPVLLATTCDIFWG